MKRKTFDKIIGVLSVYYEIDLIQVVEVSELLFFVIKIYFKKSKP